MSLTPADIAYEFEGGPARGRLVARAAGRDGEGEVRWSRAGDGLVVAEFAGVPKAWEGTGVAAAMVTHFIENARKNGDKVIPACGYVTALGRRNPDWADVMSV